MKAHTQESLREHGLQYIWLAASSLGLHWHDECYRPFFLFLFSFFCFFASVEGWRLNPISFHPIWRCQRSKSARIRPLEKWCSSWAGWSHHAYSIGVLLYIWSSWKNTELIKNSLLKSQELDLLSDLHWGVFVRIPLVSYGPWECDTEESILMTYMGSFYWHMYLPIVRGWTLKVSCAEWKINGPLGTPTPSPADRDLQPTLSLMDLTFISQ